MDQKAIALAAAKALDAKRGKDIVVLKVDEMTVITDYMVIATGRSVPQVKALAGGVLSLLAMIALSRIKGVSVIGVSALGAVGFNIGQILMAVAMLNTPQLIVTYLPVLMVSGVATGVLTGVVAQMVMKHLKVIEKKA